ncbi:MFS transporter [Granulicella sibirica]|uniref:Putative integral membrane transport protein n=1 Tax=Granulicella sibirica TaxID=2479048 RepID=A0A4Q0SZ71_9BACT|nr:MFS transporter [Granulicella sibirica]RXH56157.1 putative integral membrane transport protein [Granulicella sibirica]
MHQNGSIYLSVDLVQPERANLKIRSAKKKQLHYAWVVASVTFLILLVTAGVRATPGVLIVPLESEFGWTSASISTAIAINLALYGLIGPFAASLMERLGLRRITLMALSLLAIAVGLTTLMTRQWQLILLWGICVGSGTGFTATVLSAVVMNRWFEKNLGVVLGALTAAGATGQLLFLPLMARVVERSGWRLMALGVSGAAIIVFLIVLWLMRDNPSDVGLVPYGATDKPDADHSAEPMLRPLAALRLASRSSAFWVLAGSFFVCGASTNGLIGTHLIAACHDYGIPEVRAAGLLAVMGIFDIFGTTASGWLSDRMPSRYLLLAYYCLRGLSLIYLPHTLANGHSGLNWFAIFYGLDWVATVPPTVRLVTDCFGRVNTGVIFGWVAAAHQLGAALAAVGAGLIRTRAGDYHDAFWIAGGFCFLTGISFLFAARSLRGRIDPSISSAQPVTT